MNKKLFGTALLGLLLSAATGTFVSCKDYDDDIENLQNQIDQLRSLQSSVDALKSDLAGVQSTCQANLTSAIADLQNGDVKKAIDAAAAAQATASDAAATAAQAVSAATTAQGAADAAATAAAAAQTAADAANALAEAAKAAAEGISLEEQDAKALAEIATLAEKLAGVEGAMLKAADVEKMISDAQLAGSAVDAETLAKINAALEALNEAAASIIGKRLTSLVYAPTTYINGIEAIQFTNLKYWDWGLDPKNWKADYPSYGWNTYTQVPDYGVQVKYLVSPTGVTLDGIDSLSYRLEDAKNTRAQAKEVTLSIVDKKIEDGKLILDLKKTVKNNGGLPSTVLLNNILSSLILDLQASGLSISGDDVKALIKGSIEGKGELVLSGDLTDKGATHVPNSGHGEISLAGFGQATGNGKATMNGKIVIENGTIRLEEVCLAGWSSRDPNEQLIIAALEAKLAESVLDENEKGKDISVFSDWARVQETDATPKIHNAYARQTNGNLNEGNYLRGSTKNSHFWTFHNIYQDGTNGTDYRADQSANAKKGTDAVYLNKGWWDGQWKYYVGHEAVYTDRLDLNKVVTVCADGTEIKRADYDKYGLKFEFHMMDYNVVNNEDKGPDYLAQDYTNQAEFAELDEATGILTPKYNGSEFNAVTIGRTPVIQAVLRDTKKNDDPTDDQIIDVRYFKVKWVAKAPDAQVSSVEFTTTYAYECADMKNPWAITYSDAWVYEDVMNKFYSSLNKGAGMGKDQFDNAYTLNNIIYRLPDGVVLDDDMVEEFMATYDFDKSYNRVGRASWQTDQHVGSQTQNILLEYYGWYVNPRTAVSGGNGNIESGQYERDWKFANENNFSVNGFIYFYSDDQTQRIYVPVTLNVKKNTFYANYQQTLWNTADDKVYTEQPKTSEIDKYRNINASLRSDANYGLNKNGITTTQLVGSATKGYFYNGDAATSIRTLIKYSYDAETAQAKAMGKDDEDPWATSDLQFDKDRLAELPSPVKGSEWFTLNNGKELWYGVPTKKDPWGNVQEFNGSKSSMGAKIDDPNIYLIDNNGDTFGGNNPTPAALILVGEKVPVVVMAKQCVENVPFDKSCFYFIDPLMFTEGKDSIVLVDVKNNGDMKTINLATTVNLKESYGQNSATIILYDAALTDDALKQNNKLKDWYGVDLKGIDNTKIMTNLNKNGGKDDVCKTLLSDITDGNGKPLYVVKLENKELIQPDGVVKPGQEAATKDAGGNVKSLADKADYLIKYVDGKVDKTVEGAVQLYTTDADGKIVPLMLPELDDRGNPILSTEQATKDGKLLWDVVKENGQTVYIQAIKNEKEQYISAAALAKKHETTDIFSVDADNKVSVLAYWTGDLDKDGNPVFKAAFGVDGKLLGSANKETIGKTPNVVSETKTVNGVEITTYSVKMTDKKDADNNVVYDADGNAVQVVEWKTTAGTPYVALIVAKTTPRMAEAAPNQEAWGVPYTPKYVDSPTGNGTIEFHNMSDDAIAKGDSFRVEIPVIVDTKWRKGLRGYVRVVVKSGL